MAQRGNISGQTPEVLASVLSKAYGTMIEPDMITVDISSGAPVNHDGTVSLVAYVAWLLKQEANGKA